MCTMAAYRVRLVLEPWPRVAEAEQETVIRGTVQATAVLQPVVENDYSARLGLNRKRGVGSIVAVVVVSAIAKCI